MPAFPTRLRPRRGLPAGFGAPAAIVAGALMIALTAPSRAAEGPDEVWVVAEVDGEAYVAESDTLTALRRLTEGEVLFGQQVVVTGPDGSAVLTHGEDVVRMAPKSKLALTETSGIGGLTRLAHTMGKILVDVEKRPGWEFQVETPYLTGTVKGTSFTVTVDARGAQVDVHHGIVGVADRGGRSGADLGAGQSGRVAKDAGSKVAVGPSEGSSNLVGRSTAPAEAESSADASSDGAEGSASDTSDGQAGGQDAGSSGGSSGGKSGGSGKASDGGGSSSGGGKGKGSDGGSSSGGSGSKGKDGGSSEGSGSSDSGKGDKDKGDKGKDGEGGSDSSSGKGGKEKGDNGNAGGNGKDKGKGKDK
jgi:hypothetical protein